MFELKVKNNDLLIVIAFQLIRIIANMFSVYVHRLITLKCDKKGKIDKL